MSPWDSRWVSQRHVATDQYSLRHDGTQGTMSGHVLTNRCILYVTMGLKVGGCFYWLTTFFQQSCGLLERPLLQPWSGPLPCIDCVEHPRSLLIETLRHLCSILGSSQKFRGLFTWSSIHSSASYRHSCKIWEIIVTPTACRVDFWM